MAKIRRYTRTMQYSRGLCSALGVLVLTVCLGALVAHGFQAAGGAAAGGAAAADGAVGANSTEAILFGYDMFRSGGEPITDGPVDELYVLSAGDEVVISIWGALVEKWVLTVSDEGVIDLPEDGGRIQTNGVTLKELRPLIYRALSQIYAAYINADDPTKSTAFVDVKLGKVRKMLVYVVGEVKNPGPYALSSAVANVINLLHNAGGVRDGGSLRSIKIRRNDGRTDLVDLYEFFLTGTIDFKRSRLQPGDYLIVPLKQRAASVTGQVRRPGTYELLEADGLNELIGYAGGVTGDAYLKQSQLRRFVPNKGEVYTDFDFESELAKGAGGLQLIDGDALTIARNVQARKNIVSIRGDGVMRPGTYEWRAGMTVSELIAKGGGLREDAYLQRADLIRTEENLSKTLTLFALSDLYEAIGGGVIRAISNPEKDFQLHELDEIFVQSTFGMTGKDRYITLEGHVREPGKLVLAKNMTLYDLIFARGGFQDEAFKRATFLSMAHIIRKVSGTVGEQIIPFSLGELLAANPTANIPLQEDDVIRVYSFDELAMKSDVTIDGLVKSPGRYAMSQGLTLEDLIVLAGGLRPDAYKVEAVIARQEANGTTTGAPDRIYPTFVVPIESGYFNVPASKKTLLKAFDRVNVRNVLGWEPLDVVGVRGEVLYPGSYSLATKNETISTLVKKAGGLRKEALPEGAMIMRSRSIVNLEPGVAAVKYEVTINLGAALASPGSIEDMVLKNGDEIFIPTDPGTIEIRGAVKRPLVVQFKAGQSLSQYIALCGGYLDKADVWKTMVYSANNSAQIADGLTDLNISSGSTIEVPFQRQTERLETVEVKGAVAKAAMVQFIEGAPLGYYLSLCGGFTPNADVDNVVVHLSDGGLLVKKAGEGFNPEIPAGSIVVVTAKPIVEAK